MEHEPDGQLTRTMPMTISVKAGRQVACSIKVGQGDWRLGATGDVSVYTVAWPGQWIELVLISADLSWTTTSPH